MKKIYSTLLASAMFVTSSVFAQQPDKVRMHPSSARVQTAATQVGDDGRQHTYQPSANYQAPQGGGCDSLKTTFAMGNSNDGIMFDVVANVNLDVTFFEAILYGGTGYVYIYKRSGSHVGHELTPGAWTRVDSVQMTLTTQDSLYRIPIYVAHHMNAGDTTAFYITGDGTNISVDYTNGTAVGNVFTQDFGMKALEGTGMSFPFAATYTPRVFNGIINYCPTGYLPCQNTVSTYANGNGYDGNMFDVTTDNDITINGFWGNINGSGGMEIYYHMGTYVGTETNTAAWTRIDSGSVTSAGLNVPTYIATVNLPVPAGQTVALYITGTATGADVNYTNGTAVGNVYKYDGIISIKEGMGMPYAFTAGATPRIWNGTIDYCVGITGINSPASHSGVTTTLYPNPVSNTATLSIESNNALENVNVVISDISGRTVQSFANVSGNTLTIDASAMQSGMYIYTVYSGNGLVSTGKFIVE